MPACAKEQISIEGELKPSKTSADMESCEAPILLCNTHFATDPNIQYNV